MALTRITSFSRWGLALAALAMGNFAACQQARSEQAAPPQQATTGAAEPAAPPAIMLALLLDTSNSMDGLIEQAKSQLWRIVNELARARCEDGAQPAIRIALYEYGNDYLPASEGYIRQVSPLTDDLDLISEKLFALTTNGGEEYCGRVISTSLHQLLWQDAAADLKLIFIAGNEPFTQGRVSYRAACAQARERGVVINTIFCGGFEEGIHSQWKEGADLAGGSYMCIAQNQRTVYVATPYDKEIDALNERLNNTYVYYGAHGAEKKSKQQKEDENAGTYSRMNKVERTISKSSHAYKNESWDLVDAAEKDKDVVARVSEEQLPAALQGMTVEERQAYVAQQARERAAIQQQIQALSEQRRQYLAQQATAQPQENMLDAAMIRAMKAQAAHKRLTW